MRSASELIPFSVDQGPAEALFGGLLPHRFCPALCGPWPREPGELNDG